MKRKLPTNPTILERARKMRKEPSGPEAKLWYFMKGKNLGGFRFRRQHPIDRFIVDFYCHETKLVVELDGNSHAEQREYDAIRTAWLESKGYTVIRFWNNQVVQDTESVLQLILAKCEELSDEPRPSPSPSRGEGNGPLTVGLAERSSACKRSDNGPT